MTLLAILGISPQFLINFFWFGISLNIFSMIGTRILIAYSYNVLNNEQKEYLQKWFLQRRQYITANNSQTKIALNFWTMLLPTYIWWINMIFTYHIFKEPGIYGLMKGQMYADKFSIIQLTKYKIADNGNK